MMPSESAVALLAGLVDPVGRWGDHATGEQWADAQAILDPEAPVRRHWLGRAKGYSKTRDVAGMSLAALLTQFPPSASGYVAASDQDQAGLIRQSIAAFVAHTPGLAGQVRVDQRRVTSRSGAELVILAADTAGSHGLRPFWLVIDELCQWPDVEKYRSFFDSLWAGLPKVPGSRGIVITTAGSPTHFSRRIFETAGADALWRLSDLVGPPPWIDGAEVDAERRRLLPSVFARLWMNEWATGEDRLTTVDDVRACVVLAGPLDPVPDVVYVAGLDVGLKNDRTVLTVAHAEQVDAGRVVVVDRQFVWEGSRARPVDLSEVEAVCVQVATSYGCRFVVDPWQAALLVQRLRARRISVSEFPFSQLSIGRLAARLYSLLRERALRLPDDDGLVDELANLRLRETSPGVFRIDHDSDRHDDRAISLALAANDLLEHVPHRPARMRVSRRAHAGTGVVVGQVRWVAG
ncbi:MAG TPA: terminase large subunit [Acidimicrobiales bacterium]|jgi:hypothetical protein|nr:terminase large subunit [Acidimicrobiales bacterium]